MPLIISAPPSEQPARATSPPSTPDRMSFWLCFYQVENACAKIHEFVKGYMSKIDGLQSAMHYALCCKMGMRQICQSSTM
eukprot:749501-Hanusia_phi.AAC.1